MPIKRGDKLTLDGMPATAQSDEMEDGTVAYECKGTYGTLPADRFVPAEQRAEKPDNEGANPSDK